MDERKEVLIVCIILLAIGISFFWLTIFYSKFNFYKAELNINENIIEETLYFKTNKPYHTLYRNFKTPITIASASYPASYSQDGYIKINSVECSKGQAYAKVSWDCYIFPEKTEEYSCPFTEPNEYGCTFGSLTGFEKGEEYWIKSTYSLEPNNLFKIGGKYYIKFFAYSKNNHKLLTKGKSLITNNKNIISKKTYLPASEVILYLPYTGDASGLNIIEQKDFDFGSSGIWLSVLFFLSPTIIFFLLWFFFGKENTISEHPPELSFYPTERKAWEVAAYFNPPFSKVDKNFFSTMLIDFYRRKIIDTKMKEDEVFIKLNSDKKALLDSVEKDFFDILETIEKKCKDKNREGEYFNLKKASAQWGISTSIQSAVRALESSVKKEGKKYLDKKVLVAFTVVLVIIYMLSRLLFYFITKLSILFLIASFVVIWIVSNYSSLLIKFKGDCYKEYEHWQSYKRFLKYSTLKLHSHKGVAVWEKHLVYATALGVAKRVLKELKAAHLISEREYNLYMGSYVMAGSFATHSGASSHGGGFGGGVGGGGIGGGGGGGR